MIIKGTTSTGFEYEIDKECMEDAEFLELFAVVAKGGEGSMQVFDLVRAALGDDQKKALYDHCRNEKGRVPISAVTAEITDIFTALGQNPETKN